MTTSSTIAAQVAELRQGAAARLPADVSAAFTADQRDLEAAGLPAGIPSAGSPMPDAKLLDVTGQPTTLAHARGDEPAVVVFYRGVWCPYCDIALRTYQRQLVPELTAGGIRLIAISPQKPDGSLSAKEAKELTFTVLSDPGNELAGQLGIVITPPAEVTAGQQKLGLDLTQVNADGTTNLPMPTVVIVDAGGTIRWIDVHPDYTTRTEPALVLEALAATLG